MAESPDRGERVRGLLTSAVQVSASSNRRLAFAIAMLGTIACAVMTATPAPAALLRAQTSTITGSGATALDLPNAVAVDNSSGPSAGSVYVVDPTHFRVEKFSPAGDFLLMFGKSVNSGTGNANICTNAGPPTDVCQAGSTGTGGGEFHNTRFIAVDSSNGPSQGDVYVADNFSAVIQKFAPDGTLITTWGASPAPGQIDGQGVVNGPFNTIAGITVDNGGNLLVINTESRVWKFAQNGTPPSTSFTVARGTNELGVDVDSAGDLFKLNGDSSMEKLSPTGTDYGQTDLGFTGAGFAYDRANNDLYVSHFNNSVTRQHFTGTTTVFIPPATTCTFAQFSGCDNTESFGQYPTLNNPGGLAVSDTSGYVYVANRNAHDVSVWGTGIVPDVTTGPSTPPFGSSTARITGTVDPAGGGDVIDCYFKYGTDTSYSSGTTPCLDSGDAVTGTGGNPISAPTDVHADLSLLTPDVTYHYELVASNAFAPSEGVDRTTTPHAVIGLTTEPPSNLQTESATLNGSYVATDDDTTYHFEWGTSTSYAHSTTAVGPEHEVSGTRSISTDIVGLVPGNTYHYRVVASNSVGTSYGEDVTFDAPQIPAVVSQSVSNVTATSVDLNATINPHSSPTTYRFEYGPTPSYGNSAPEPEGTLGPSDTAEPVTVHLDELTPHLVYHFQVVATNAYGTAKSGDLSFNFYPPSCPNQTIRQQTNADSLPDCRAYELVSPEDAGTVVIFSGPTPQSPTATSPSRTTFAGLFGAIPGAGDPPNVRGDLYMSTRTSTGWKTRYVGLPASMAQWSGGPPWNIAYNNSYYAQNFADVLTTPSMSQIGIWDRGYYYCNVNDYATCQTDGSGEGAYGLPDVPKGHSDAPYVVDSTTGAITDRWPTNVGAVPYGEKFVGHTDASANMSHFIFTSNIPFVPGGQAGSSPPGQAIPGGNPGDMYDNDIASGTLSIVNRDSSGDPLEAMPVETSDDGSHILMTIGGARVPGTWAKTSGPGELFMRVDDAMTYDIAPGHAVQYVDMTPDGSKVYFTSSQDLTADGSDTDTSRDLYMWSETSNSPNHITLISKGNDGTSGNTDSCNASWTSQCNVGIITFSGTDVYNLQYTDQLGGAGGAAQYENVVAPANGDIYFLSPEQLDGDYGVPGAENLYDYRGGELQFVTALTPESPSCVYNQGTPACSATAVARMEISPDDSHMAFLTSSQVTSYDNAGHSEIYLYTPASGDLRCTSCLPSGEPPSMDVTASHDGRFMTDDGRTFFNTDEPLVPQDTNQATDVYEYADGRPQLITSGTAPANNSFGLSTIFSVVGLTGVSADGTDVYFSTTDTLINQDRNGNNVKIYDARTGGGFAFVPPPPGCAAADECHGPSSSAPAGMTIGTRGDLGDSGNLDAGKKSQKKNKRKATKKRHGRHKKAHRRGRRNG